MSTNPISKVAVFVSPHGFGHAARISAVIEALSRRAPNLRCGIFTRVPRWFFEETLGAEFEYYFEDTDLGLVQKDPLNEDLEATLAGLRERVPPPPEILDRLAEQLLREHYRAVICDVSPLGLAVARHAGLPSVLVENFTWDWIYRAYVDEQPEFAGFAECLAEISATATLHISAQPACGRWVDERRVGPIARSPRVPPEEVKRQLGLEPGQAMVLVTMGGIEFEYPSLKAFATNRRAAIVVPGGCDRERVEGDLIRLPHHSRFYHPDLVSAADVVVGKIGYSTLAEVFDAGAAYGYVPRPSFPESPVLAAFVDRELEACAISAAQFERAEWLAAIDDLLDRERRPRGRATGATEAALMIGEELALL